MIGIFDSGSGGLTVLKSIRELLPSCDVLYFGDIKNAPYGGKSREELSVLTVHAIQVLEERGIQNIVSACNSTSASLAVSLFDTTATPIHLIEMVGPTVAYLKNSKARVLLCATPATIQSGIYQNAFRMVGKEIQTLAIKELAGAIERGLSSQEIKNIVKEAFKDIPKDSFDILVLGCTHYPLVANTFAEVVGPSALVFDPSIAVAERAEKLFWPQEAGDGKTTFLISKDSPVFRTFVAKLFPSSVYTVEVVE